MIIIPRHVVEVGAGDSSPNTQKYWDLGIPITLFEPNIILYNRLIQKTRNYKNVRVFNCAISNMDGFVDFYLLNYYSFLKGIHAPIQGRLKGAAEEIYATRKTKVLSKTFDFFDTGDIDILYLDSEGCDYFIIQRLISKPIIINFGMFDENQSVSPYCKFVLKWFTDNNYICGDVKGSRMESVKMDYMNKIKEINGQKVLYLGNQQNQQKLEEFFKRLV